MKTLRLIMILSTLLAPMAANGAASLPVSDPVQAFIDGETFGPNSEVYVIRADFNGDGVDDFLISSNTEMRDGARSGTRWDIYASAPEGFIMVDNQRRSLYLRNDAMSIRPIPELNGQVGIVGYFPSNADRGTFTTYIVSDDFKLEVVNSEMRAVSDGKGGMDASILQEEFGEVPSPDMEIIAQSELKDTYGVEIIASTSPSEPEFFYVRDKNNPRRTLVYSFKTKELVGYEQYGKFTPIEDITQGEKESIDKKQSDRKNKNR